jgi:hypothetical protein
VVKTQDGEPRGPRYGGTGQVVEDPSSLEHQKNTLQNLLP